MLASSTSVLLTTGLWTVASALQPGDHLHGQRPSVEVEVVRVGDSTPIESFEVVLSDGSSLVTDATQRIFSWSPAARTAEARDRLRKRNGTRVSLAGRPRSARQVPTSIDAVARSLTYRRRPGGAYGYQHGLKVHGPRHGAIDRVRRLLADRDPSAPEAWASWSVHPDAVQDIVDALLLAGITPRVDQRSPTNAVVTARPPAWAWPVASKGAVWSRGVTRRGLYRTVRSVTPVGLVDCVSLHLAPPPPDRPESWGQRAGRHQRDIEALIGRGLVPVLGDKTGADLPFGDHPQSPSRRGFAVV